jgi:hypothetical protein
MFAAYFLMVQEYLYYPFNGQAAKIAEFQANNVDVYWLKQWFFAGKYIFKEEGKRDLLNIWLENKCSNIDFMNYFTQAYDIQIHFMYILRWSILTNVITKDERDNIINNMCCTEDNNIDIFESLLDRIFEYIKNNYNKDESKKMIDSIKEDTALQLGFSI